MMGPTLDISKEIHASKYRLNGESFEQAMHRIAPAMASDKDHEADLLDGLLNMRILPAGRVQAAMGSPRVVTPYNCFVSGKIEDSYDSIMQMAYEAGATMRMGGGIGYDFSSLRPRGALIRSLDAKSSGPVSFMRIYDAICSTIAGAGHRRGAQMATLRVDHPDIEEFIHAKQNSDALNNFNISVTCTDDFMHAVQEDDTFDLKFEGQVYKTVRARALWDQMMRSTWDYAEPGVLFIDRINKKNNLWYCEEIETTNPCAEQPLGPYSACLLSSLNLVKYVDDVEGIKVFNVGLFVQDVDAIVRALDNVVDRATYPLAKQEEQAKAKRRMGVGVTGLANTAAILGYSYGSPEMLDFTKNVLEILRDTAYLTSVDMAKEKGPFPLFNADLFLKSEFALTLPDFVRNMIREHGIRNSHLLSIAPTGTISLAADNVSSGVEPPYTWEYERTIQTFDGPKVVSVTDYAYREYGIKGKTADQISVDDHVNVLNLASKYVDSAVSKTCNVGDNVSYEEFKDVYMKAFLGGASGCTTFRASGKRFGILNASVEVDKSDEQKAEGQACTFDLETGRKSCE